MQPEVTVGGVRANVQYAGAFPGFPGVYQVNIQLPENVPRGLSIPISLSVRGISSNVAALAIQ